jgi:hypothetical protein
VIRAPDSLTDWEHALLVGTAEQTTLTVDHGADSAQNGPSGRHSFPIVVVGANETYPITTDTRFTKTDQLIVLTRPDTSSVATPASQ